MSSSKASTYELAEMFAYSPRARNLSVITGVDDDPPVSYPSGRWQLIEKRQANSVLMDDIAPVQVQAMILGFMRECDAHITSGRVREVERLARLLFLESGFLGGYSPDDPAPSFCHPASDGKAFRCKDGRSDGDC